MRIKSDETGATAVEYGLMVVAIAAVITIVVVVIGGYVKGQFKETCTAIDGQGVTNANPSGGTCNS